MVKLKKNHAMRVSILFLISVLFYSLIKKNYFNHSFFQKTYFKQIELFEVR